VVHALPAVEFFFGTPKGVVESADGVEEDEAGPVEGESNGPPGIAVRLDQQGGKTEKAEAGAQPVRQAAERLTDKETAALKDEVGGDGVGQEFRRPLLKPKVRIPENDPIPGTSADPSLLGKGEE